MLKQQIFFIRLAVLIICSLSFTFSSLAKDIKFEATVDRNKIPIGETAQLNLTFQGTQKIPPPKLPDIKGFQSQYLGPSTMMSIVNGKVSSSITHMYTLIPLKIGTFKIGPFSFKYRGNTYTSNSVKIEVVKGIVQGESKSKEQPKLNFGDRVFLVMKAKKKKAYINELIPVTVKLYVNRLTIRDIQYPQIPHNGFSIREFSKPKQYQEVSNGVIYDVIEFKTQIFATRDGKLILGPASLKCNLIVKKERKRNQNPFFGDFFNDNFFEDFFGKYESYPINLKSSKILINILPLPKKGKPSDFSGAVGNFNLSVKVSPTEVNVGDPITLRMVISGEGNFETVTCPKLSSSKGFKVYQPEIKEEKNKKVFEQVLIPKTDTIKEIPKINFSSFNPEKGCYETSSKSPIPITVKKVKEKLEIVEMPRVSTKPLKKEKIGKGIVYIKESPGKLKRKGRYLYNNRIFLMLQILPLFLYISLLTFHRRKEKLRSDSGYARRLIAPKEARKGIKEAKRAFEENKSLKFYDTVFLALRKYLGNRFGLSPAGITEDFVDEVLKPKGVDKEVMDKLRKVFQDCNMTRYAPSEFGRDKMEETLKRMEEIIDYLEKQKL